MANHTMANHTMANPPHVVSFYEENLANSVLDMLCGLLLVLFFVFGSLANALAARFFTMSWKRSLVNKLYSAITICDFATCVLQLPVMVC